MLKLREESLDCAEWPWGQGFWDGGVGGVGGGGGGGSGLKKTV